MRAGVCTTPRQRRQTNVQQLLLQPHTVLSLLRVAGHTTQWQANKRVCWSTSHALQTWQSR